MKRICLLVFTFFIICNLNANNDQQDSLKEKTITIESKLHQIESQNSKDIIQNDNLQKQLSKLEINQQYYTTGLGIQTGIFSVIIAIVIALFSFLSFKRFEQITQSQKKEIEGILDEQSKKIDLLESLFNDQKMKFEDSLDELYLVIAKNNILIAPTTGENSQMALHFLEAARYFIMSRNQYSETKKYLGFAYECLSSIPLNQEQFDAQKESLNKTVSKLNSDNEEIDILIAKIKVKMFELS